MRKVIVVSVLTITLAACTGGSEDPVPSASARPYPREGFRFDSTPLPNGMYRFIAGSPPVELGVAYEFSISTHCGIDFLVDFDGSFWDQEGSGPSIPARTGPSLAGTMTLVERGVAEFRIATGERWRFHRGSRTKQMGLCS